MDPACGIAEAEFSAAFIIAAASAELRAIKSGKQASAAGLAGYSCQGVLRRCRAGRGVLRWIGHARAGAANQAERSTKHGPADVAMPLPHNHANQVGESCGRSAFGDVTPRILAEAVPPRPGRREGKRFPQSRE